MDKELLKRKERIDILTKEIACATQGRRSPEHYINLLNELELTEVFRFGDDSKELTADVYKDEDDELFVKLQAVLKEALEQEMAKVLSSIEEKLGFMPKKQGSSPKLIDDIERKIDNEVHALEENVPEKLVVIEFDSVGKFMLDRKFYSNDMMLISAFEDLKDGKSVKLIDNPLAHIVKINFERLWYKFKSLGTNEAVIPKDGRVVLLDEEGHLYEIRTDRKSVLLIDIMRAFSENIQETSRFVIVEQDWL